MRLLTARVNCQAYRRIGTAPLRGSSSAAARTETDRAPGELGRLHSLEHFQWDSQIPSEQALEKGLFEVQPRCKHIPGRAGPRPHML